MKIFITLVLTLSLLTSCTVGPKYARPQVPLPARLGPPGGELSQSSIADLGASALFHDEALTHLLKTALVQNNDIHIAAERVLESRAQYAITRSNIFPTADATANFTSERSSSVGSITFIPPGLDLSSSYTQAGLSLSWELDFWGRLRKLTQSARAQVLASEQARRAVVATVVSSVASDYIVLLELDKEIDIANHTQDIAQKSLHLTELRHQRGAAAGLDIKQAQELLYTATAQLAATQRLRAETENDLHVLLGENPGAAFVRDRKLEQLPNPPIIPAGLPSALLERRPDIRQAEAILISANAEIGAAKALYFPQITLSGLLGGQSRALTSLFTGPARQWAITPVGDLPIFNAGRIRGNVHFAEATKREMVWSYQKAVQNAFREVSDALNDHDQIRQEREQQELFVNALQDASQLSELRYKGGLDSFLQVLDAQRNLFQGQLTLARLRRDELLSVVRLYRALGGGWNG